MKWQGETVYLFSTAVADGMNSLYDKEGKLLGQPTGGFTGRGDGKFPNFSQKTRDRVKVWEMPRDGNAEFQHFLGRVKRVEASSGAKMALKMWEYHLKRFKGEQKAQGQKEIERLKKAVGK